MSEEALPPQARAGDSDRKRTAERLRSALDEGRLDLAEYDERLQAAYQAKTYRELDELVSDIPGVTPISRSVVEKVTAEGKESVTRQRQRRKRRDIKKSWSSFGGAAIFFTGIWGIGWIASGSMPTYWPLWILGIWGIITLCQTWAALTRD